MTSLRERLESRAVRRVTVTIQVSDPAADVAAGEAAAAELAAARAARDDEAIAVALTAAGAAGDAIAGHFADVVFRQLPRSDFEVLLAAHTRDDGGVDHDALAPVLLAASADDDSLRDDTWWAGLLTGPAWSSGDWHGTYWRVFGLNADPPPAAAGKG